MRTHAALVIDPPAAAWRSVIDQSWSCTRNDANAMRLREELGLPTDAPVVMSGHQPGFWHPGVLAKRIALREARESLGCAGAWLVVDQDEVDFGIVRVPEHAADGSLRLRDIRFREAPPDGSPVCTQSAFAPTDTPEVRSIEGVRAGLDAMVRALWAHRDAPNAAAQLEGAATALAGTLIGDTRAIMATTLARTAQFGEIVERIFADARGCVEAYNAATANAPGAGVAPLVRDSKRQRWELPLWVIERGVRRRVWSDEAGKVDARTLAPRALLMTALVRMDACDLFIHGTGGFAYDRVTEEWARSWLGRALAPMACVSATLTLSALGGGGSDVVDAARAVWTAHHARHNPGAVGAAALAERKREALARIERAKRNGGDAAGAYRELHALLVEHRELNAAALRGLEERAESARRRAREAAVANDRTYAFPLHGEKSLMGLRDEIRAAFRGG